MTDKWVEYIQWNFPGEIFGIVAAALALTLLVFSSYYFTLRNLTGKQRFVLGFLRATIFLLILFCLCNPRTVMEKRVSTRNKKKIAVVLDSSSSMLKKGFTNKSRMEVARNYWNKKIKPVQRNYDYNFFTFSESFKKIKSFDNLNSKIKPVKNTCLFDAVNTWTERLDSEKYDGVICFTDGIDNSDTSIEEPLDKLENSSLSHVFIPVTTKLPTVPYAKFARLECVSSARIGTEVPVMSIISCSGLDPSEKLSMIVENDKKRVVFKKEISVNSSATESKVVKFNIPVKEARTHRFKAVLRSRRKIMSQFVWSVQGFGKERISILLYQGGLDWGTRFLRTAVALEKEDFSLDVKFAPGSFGNKKINVENLHGPFPSMAELEKYNVVIILKMRKEQLSEEIEKNLRKFIKDGGALLFVIANSISARDYANSPLESLLPVVFENTHDASSELDGNTAAFLDKMKKYRSPKKMKYIRGKEYTVDVPPLTEMKLTREGRISPVFRYLESKSADGKPFTLPKFQDFALITKQKPGASVLAVHPSFQAGNKSRILMAVQQYGEGKSAVLATDPLWRWKLTLDSSDRSYSKFWKQFLGWLTAGVKTKPYWVFSSSLLEPNKESKIIFKIPSVSDIKFNDLKFYIENLNDAEKSPLILSKINTEDFSVSVTPKNETSYRLVAENKNGLVAEGIFSSAPDSANKELTILKPSIETIRALSETSNAFSVSISENFNWNKWLPFQQGEVRTIKKEIPIWHKNWIFLLILILFSVDLCLRRRFKLV